MRLFLSINWNKQFTQSLEMLQEQLKRAGVKGYWRQGENLHLTLKFLGETDSNLIREISRNLEQIRMRQKSFEVQITGLGVFPNLRSPRILWLGVKSDTLLRLQSDIDKALYLNFPVDHRTYQPHITLASGGITGLNHETLKLGDQVIFKEEISSIYLMESKVTEKRRVYKIVEEYNLRS
jgi:RNA 2',3'-cyclic 3'-phosphodiesterase